jgi:hypothetical protein
MEKICGICNAQNIEKAKFCASCGNQLTCVNCNEELLTGANNCISCGVAIKRPLNSMKSPSMNTIDFRQTKEERIIKVAFTNEAAKEVRESIVQMSSMRAGNLKFIENGALPQMNSDGPVTEVDEALDIPGEEIKPKPNTEVSTSTPHLNDIQKLQCSEAEWILIMAFYKSGNGTLRFTREAVRELYIEHRQTASRTKNYMANWNSLFGTQKGLIVTIKDNLFELTDSAKQKVTQLINGEVRGNAGTGKKSNKKKGTTTDATEIKENGQKADKRSAPPKASTLSLLANLNLNPSGKKSLKNFYESYQVPDALPEKNLIMVYYLERVSSEKNIGINHVYTCYKHLGMKVPGNLYQSLLNTRARKGWIDTANISDLKITVAGENYVEHDLPKV